MVLFIQKKKKKWPVPNTWLASMFLRSCQQINSTENCLTMPRSNTVVRHYLVEPRLPLSIFQQPRTLNIHRQLGWMKSTVTIQSVRPTYLVTAFSHFLSARKTAHRTELVPRSFCDKHVQEDHSHMYIGPRKAGQLVLQAYWIRLQDSRYMQASLPEKTTIPCQVVFTF